MKTQLLMVSLLAALGLFLAGCNKSEESTPGGANAAASNAAASGKTTQPTGPVELKLKWPVGAHYTQRMDLNQQMETSISSMPKTMKQEVEMSQDFGLTVLTNTPEGGREIEMEFESMQITVSAGDRVQFSFDSHGESLDGNQNPMAAMFRSLVGTRIKYILDVSNHVVRLEGLQEFRNKALANAPAQARSAMAQMLSEDSFKQMINFGQGLPDKPVRAGDAWPVHTEITMGPLGIMELDMQYVFKGFEEHDQRNCALLDFTGIMKSKPARESANPNMKMSIEEGVTTGKSWFDPELGMVIGSDINQDIKMNIQMAQLQPPGFTNTDSNTPPPARTMSTMMKQNIKITITPSTAEAKAATPPEPKAGNDTSAK